jgi:hypothetical protein
MSKKAQNAVQEVGTVDPTATKEISPRMQVYYAREAKISQLVEYVLKSDMIEAEDEIKKVAQSLVTRAAPSGEKKPRAPKADSIFTKVANLFKSTPTQSEDSLWNELKVGREEMRKIRKDALNKPAEGLAANRLWISFNVETGIYVLEGTGEMAPEGWKGFMPKAPKAEAAPTAE